MDRTVIDYKHRASVDRAHVVVSSKGRGWRGLEAEFLRIPAGLTHVPGSSSHRLGIHFGRSVNADCQCDGRRHRRVQAHGDIDIVPAGLDGSWEDDRECRILRLRVSPALVRQAATDLGRDPQKVTITPKFQLRDPRIESIAWAVKAELEAGLPSDRLFAETLATALAIRLVEAGDQPFPTVVGTRQVLSPRQRRMLVEFIDTHLDRSLALADLATVVGLSVSHLKTLFRNTFNTSVHHYVVRCRVERARSLLLSREMPMSQIALEAGFAHQSHMAYWMRRVLGLTPGAVVRTQG